MQGTQPFISASTQTQRFLFRERETRAEELGAPPVKSG